MPAIDARAFDSLAPPPPARWSARAKAQRLVTQLSKPAARIAGLLALSAALALVSLGAPILAATLAGLSILAAAALLPGVGASAGSGADPSTGRDTGIQAVQPATVTADEAGGPASGGAASGGTPDEGRRAPDPESWRAVVEAMPDAAVVIDAESSVLGHNPAAADLFPSLRTGRPITHASRNPGLIEAVDRALATRGPLAVQITEHVPIERRLAVSLSRLAMAPLPPPARTPVLLVTFRDLTEQDRLDQMRQDFIANASHELRTPLASLKGFVETLQGPARDDPAARERFLAIMSTQAQRMTRLIDDLLSLSRVEMKQHLPPRGVVDLDEVVTYVAQTLEPLAAGAQVTLRMVRPGGPARVRGEREELAQALLNLAQNAVKYGRAGGHVTIRLQRLPAAVAGSGGRLAVSVEDDGPGIAPQHLPRLVERFYRVNAASSREKGGTGLGLAIVKHIVLRHRGELRIESQVGHGSVFTIEFEAITR